MTTEQIASTIYAHGFHGDKGNPGNQLALARQFAATLSADDAAFESEPFIRACTTGAWPA